jgi:thioredoxin
MKKSDFILIGLVLVIIVVAIFSTRGTKAEEDIEYPLTLTGEVGLNQITYSDYKKMVEDGDAFVVVIERAGCGYCQMYMPILEEYAKEKQIAVTYIDTDTLTENEFNELSNTNKYLKKNNWGTPTTLFMLGDRVIDVIGGYVEKDSIDRFFKDRVVMGE